jgi:hypothetical protein
VCQQYDPTGDETPNIRPVQKDHRVMGRIGTICALELAHDTKLVDGPYTVLHGVWLGGHPFDRVGVRHTKSHGVQQKLVGTSTTKFRGSARPSVGHGRITVDKIPANTTALPRPQGLAPGFLGQRFGPTKGSYDQAQAQANPTVERTVCDQLKDVGRKIVSNTWNIEHLRSF